MALDDIRRKLFRPGEEFEERYQRPKLEKHKEEVESSWRPEPELDKEEKTQTNMILWWGVGGGLGVIIIGIVFFLLFFGGFGIGGDTVSRVDLAVEALPQATAGKKAVWRVKYRNNNSMRLENTAIIFEFPSTAQPVVGEFSKNALRERRDIGSIEPGVGGEETFQAILFGAKGDSLSGKVKIEYRPTQSSARYTKETSYTIDITSTLLGVELVVPDQLKSGQEVEIKLKVVSTSDTVFRGLSAHIEYPGQFEFISAEPKPARADNIWRIGDIGKDKEFFVSIRGRFKESDVAGTARVKVGVYDPIQRDITIPFNTITKSIGTAPALLAVSLGTKGGEIADGVISAGSRVEGFVQWRNNLPVAVKNAAIEVVFEGDAIDLAKLKSDEGEYNAVSNSLQWVPGRVPQLLVVDPGVGGAFPFQFSVKKEIPQTGVNNKNFTIRLKARIKSLEVPVGFEGVDVSGETQKEYKIASRYVYSQKGYYYNSFIGNTGPLPPRVGQETTYTIVWSVVNTVNDIDKVVARATIPSYVVWKKNTVPPDPTLTFNETTRELTWAPGIITAGTGSLRPPREVAFQIGFTPSLPHVGTTPELVSESTFDARDTFTGVVFASQKANALTTQLRDDPRASGTEGRVVQ